MSSERRYALLGHSHSAVAEVNDLSAAVTWANIPDANVPESAVTQHEAALSIIAGNVNAESSTDGWVLTSDGIGNAVWEVLPAAVGSLANVVEDTTPQLGGDLDLNSNDVTGTGNLDITGGIDITGILEVAGTAPQMPRLVESDAAADEGGWYGYANGGTLRWPITRRDSGAAGQWFFEFDRTGYLADSITVGGEVDDIFLNNTELSDFSFRDHKAVANTPNISSGVATLDYSTGPAFTIELDENVTSWTLSNIPAGFYFIEIIIRLYQDQTGGRTVAWTGFTNLKWPGGVAPTITATAATGSGIDDAFPDIISMKSFDGGGNWYGDYSIGYAA